MSAGHSLGEQDDTKSNFFTFFPSDLLVFSSLAEHSSSKKNVMKIWTENKENEITTPLPMDCDDDLRAVIDRITLRRLVISVFLHS